VDLTRNRLYDTGRFGLVNVSLLARDSGAVADMGIEVEETEPHEVRLGFGVGVDRVRYEARARASYVEHGFLGPLYTLRLRAQPAYVWLRAKNGEQGPVVETKATVERDDVVIPRLRWSNTAGYAVQERLAYALRGPDFDTHVDFAMFGDRLRLGVGWKIRLGSFTRIEGAISHDERSRVGLGSQSYRLAYVWQSLVYDRRNDPLNARSGYYLELAANEASGLVGSDSSYFRLIPEARAYLPLHRRLVVAARMRAGVNLASRGELPITERFFAGGANFHSKTEWLSVDGLVTSIETLLNIVEQN